MSANIRNSLIAIAIVVMVGVLLLLFSGEDDTQTANEINSTLTVAQDSEVAGTASDAPISSGTSGVYANYNGETSFEGDTVLFFHASWCSTCNLLDKNIKKDLDEIPADLTILKLDYDNELDLRRKYGVNTQHTLISVDAEGNELNRLVGGYNVDDVVGIL